MASSGPEVVFGGLENARTEVYPAAGVGETVWSQIKFLHHEQLLAALPHDRRDDADLITRWREPLSAYQDRRVHPQRYILEGGSNRDQLLLWPKVALTYDVSGQLVSSVLTALNTSGPAAWGKMVAPLATPRLGGHRYLKLQEVVAHPDVQRQRPKPRKAEGQALRISGFVVAGVYHALKARSEQQQVSAFVVEGDPADLTLESLAKVLRMHQISRRDHTFRGYDHGKPLVTYRTNVVEAAETILAMPGAQALKSMAVTRHTRLGAALDRWGRQLEQARQLHENDTRFRETRHWGK